MLKANKEEWRGKRVSFYCQEIATLHILADFFDSFISLLPPYMYTHTHIYIVKAEMGFGSQCFQDACPIRSREASHCVCFAH